MIDALKEKALYWFAGPVFGAIRRGEHGAFLQRAYVATEGYKTVIGGVLSLFLLALTQYAPPYATTALRALNMVAVVLLAGGLIDKAYKNEPLLPPGMLEAVAFVAHWLTWLQGGLVLLETFVPGTLYAQLDSYLYAGVAATAFVNRVARASALNPKPTTAGGTPPTTG